MAKNEQHGQSGKTLASLSLNIEEFKLSVEAERHILVSALPEIEPSEVDRLARRNAWTDAVCAPSSRRKHQHLAHSQELASKDPSPMELLIHEELATRVRDALDKVIKKPADKKLIARLYFSDKDELRKDIAQSIGISPATLSKRAAKLRELLRKELEQDSYIRDEEP